MVKRLLAKKILQNGFNDFFTNVGPSLANQIPKCDGDFSQYLSSKRRGNIVSSIMIFGNKKYDDIHRINIAGMDTFKLE